MCLCIRLQQGEVKSLEAKGIKTVAKNRQVYHDYFVEETLEAGIELCGTEVKSLRQADAT